MPVKFRKFYFNKLLEIKKKESETAQEARKKAKARKGR